MNRWTNGLPGATMRQGAKTAHRGLAASQPGCARIPGGSAARADVPGALAAASIARCDAGHRQRPQQYTPWRHRSGSALSSAPHVATVRSRLLGLHPAIGREYMPRISLPRLDQVAQQIRMYTEMAARLSDRYSAVAYQPHRLEFELPPLSVFAPYPTSGSIMTPKLVPVKPGTRQRTD